MQKPVLSGKKRGVWLVGFNVGQELHSGLLPTVGKPSLRMVRRHTIATLILHGPRFGTPRGVIWMGTWRTLHPRRILHAPGAISVHRGVSPGKPRTRVLRFGAEWSTEWTNTALFEKRRWRVRD